MSDPALNQALDNAGIAPEPRSRPVLAAATLAWRELVRFFRQRNRIVGAIGTPLLFWLLFATGLDQSFRLSPAGIAADQSFGAYYFPGTLVLILLFTAIFATISIIEDRREGFLQSVLVAPIPSWSVVAGKVAGGSAIAMIQALIFLLLALTLDVDLNFLRLVELIALMTVVAVGLTSLGFLIAWRMDSTQGFHAIMNLVLMPMWLLSGSFFPLPRAGDDSSVIQLAMRWAMTINPVTYGVAGIRQLLYAGVGPALDLPSRWVCWSVTLAFAAAGFAVAVRVAGGRTKGDLQ